MAGENGRATVEVTTGFPGAETETLTRADRLARRAALDMEDAERALTRIVAHLSGLTVDEVLYRGDPPAEQSDAAWVRVTGEAAEPSPDFRSFTALFAGRELVPGAVSAGFRRVLGELPLHWVTVTGGALASPVTAAELKLGRPAKFAGSAAGGRRIATFEAEFQVRICTSPPRSVTRSGADRAGLR